MKEALAHLDAVRPRLLIGPLQAAYAHDVLQRQHGVTHVIDAGGQRYEEGAYAEYMHVDVRDELDADIGSLLAGTTTFISDALAAGGAVLVHCEAGKSRSAAIVAAFLMASEGLSADAAVESVRAAHPRADPNGSFRRQLSEASFLDELQRIGWRRHEKASQQTESVEPSPDARAHMPASPEEPVDEDEGEEVGEGEEEDEDDVITRRSAHEMPHASWTKGELCAWMEDNGTDFRFEGGRYFVLAAHTHAVLLRRAEESHARVTRMRAMDAKRYERDEAMRKPGPGPAVVIAYGHIRVSEPTGDCDA